MERKEGEQRHIQLAHFLANGCTELTRGLVEKLVELSKPAELVDKSWSLDDFLFENMKNLSKSNPKQQRILFPGRREKSDIEKWDLALLCFVITNCTASVIIQQDIHQLKQIRNNIYHAGNTDFPQEAFDRNVQILDCVVERCYKFIDKPNFSEKMKALLADFKKGNVIVTDKDYEVIRQWYENDPVALLLSKVDGLSDDNRLMLSKLEEVLVLVKENGLKGIVLPDTNVELIVKNCDSAKEKVISEQLIKLLKGRIAKDVPDVPEADQRKILDAVREAMAELLTKGRELVDIYQACVNFTIRCPTYESLRDLWIDCMTGRLTEVFKPLETYVRQLTGCPDITIEVGITQFEFYRCFEATVMQIAKAIRSEQDDVFEEHTDLFPEIAAASVDNNIDTDSSRLSPDEDAVNQTERVGTRVVVRLQPTSFNQAEHMWEACQSGSFNDKLEKLSQVFQEAYGYSDLKITAKTESTSPYEDIFRNRKRIQPDNEDGHIEKEIVKGGQSHELQTTQQTSEEPQCPQIDENRSTDERVDLLVYIHQTFQETMRSLGINLDRLEQKRKERERSEYTLNDFDTVCSHKHGVLGKDLEQQKESLQLSVLQCLEEIQNIECRIKLETKELRDKFQQIRAYLENVIPDLKREVVKIQQELTHKYIEFSSSEILGSLNSRCPDVGYVLNELKETDINKWKQLEARSASTESVDDLDEFYSSIYTYIQTVFSHFIQSTFIITDQGDYCVRLYQKRLPAITLRCLAMDHLYIRSMEVKASFLEENDISELVGENRTRGTQIPKLKSPYMSLNGKKADEKCQVTFDNLEFESEFADQLKSSHSPTSFFENHYRFVFSASIEGTTYKTMSLPVVLTTDANQSCCALASVMWHCYDINNFLLPCRRNNVLPWSRVAEMLKAKFKKICPTRALTSENLNHLKRRLLENEHVPDETPVSLSRFCYEPLSASCRFSFWKWFLGNYNLVDLYLKPYWENGLIAGFLSRIDVELMYKKEQILKSGTFMLRFSDNHITDSVGTKSVFGYLTAVVALKVALKGELVTRIEAIEVADDKKLRGKNLANILRESLDRRGVNNIYKYLFPGYIKREDCFDKYCLEDRPLSGYIMRQDVFITDLEQELVAVRNNQQHDSTRRRESESSDSGDSGINSVSPSDARSLSPTHGLSGFYHHAESVMSIPIDLQSPSSPENTMPKLEELFISSRDGVGSDKDANIPEHDAKKTEVINNLVEKLLMLARSSPESFSTLMKFLLSQVPKDILEKSVGKSMPL